MVTRWGMAGVIADRSPPGRLLSLGWLRTGQGRPRGKRRNPGICVVGAGSDEIGDAPPRSSESMQAASDGEPVWLSALLATGRLAG
jgi:hypothetical protein